MCSRKRPKIINTIITGGQGMHICTAMIKYYGFYNKNTLDSYYDRINIIKLTTVYSLSIIFVLAFLTMTVAC